MNRRSSARSLVLLLSLFATFSLRGQEPAAAGGGETRDSEAARLSADDPVPGGSGEVVAAETGQHPETYLDFAVAGGYLMIPIGLCSVLWLAFLTERLVAIRRSRVLPAPLLSSLKNLDGGPLDSRRVEALCEAHPSSAARVVRAAAEKIHQPREEIERSVNNAALREVHGLERYVRLFAVLAAVTPLIGLLGTVIGMIQAFREVAIQGLGSGQALAPGIYKALVTTAAGLMVAIPALVTYHWLMSRIDNYVHELDTMIVDFVDVQKPRGDAAPAAAS